LNPTTLNSVPGFGDALDQRRLRSAQGRVTGVTVITTRTAEGRLEGLTANSFSPVSLKPPLVLWSLRDTASCLPSFEAASHFAVNVLGAWQAALAHRARIGRLPPAVWGHRHLRMRAGDDRGRRRSCRVLGRIQRAAYRAGEPLTFSAGKYGTNLLLE